MKAPGHGKKDKSFNCICGWKQPSGGTKTQAVRESNLNAHIYSAAKKRSYTPYAN